MSTSKWIPILSNPLEGEAMTIIFGLQVSGEVSFSSFDFETDNLHLDLLLHRHFSSLNSLRLLVDDILDLTRHFV